MIERTAPAQTSSARERRARRAASLATTLRRSLAAHDVSHARAALDLGVPRQRLDEWCDADGDAQLRASDIAALPPAVARDVLRSIADTLGLAVVELPQAASVSCVKAAARLVREVGEVVSDVLEAHDDDDTVDAAEGARIEPQALEVVTHALVILHVARRAQRERVVSITEGARVPEGRRVVPRRAGP